MASRYVTAIELHTSKNGVLLPVSPETKYCRRSNAIPARWHETDTGALGPQRLRVKYNDVLSSQGEDVPALLAQTLPD